MNQKTIGLVGVPNALGQKLDGVEKTPQLLRQAGLQSLIESLGWQVKDYGDIDIPIKTNAEAAKNSLEKGKILGQASQKVAAHVKTIATQEDFTLILGGDHSTAFGSVHGILQAHPDTAVIWVDAHGDINTPETSPSGNLHGMPVAALLGLFQGQELSGFEWLEPLLKPRDITFIGLRDLDSGEKKLLRDYDIKVFTMHEIDRYGIGQVMDMALQAINPGQNKPIHVSFDIDSLDPYIAPATGTRVRGGLTYREAHYILEVLSQTNQLKSMDLVEINPAITPLYLQGSTETAGQATLELGIELIASALGKRIL